MSRIMSTTLVVFFLSLFVRHVASLGATDTITWGGDNSRTGYQTNHNMDPNIVGSAQFGQIFQAALPGTYNGVPEQIYSQTLVYTTPADGIQYLYVATTQNNIYKMDAKTGAVILKRNLAIPFLSADLDGCVDINPHVGVTATGVIDPDTDTWYLTSKTYLDQAGGNAAQGLLNGRYYIHAIDVNDLSERANFPVPLEGTVATNNPVRVFGGGIHHQRPALLHTGQYIYAGFASHCVHDNFTGWIIGWDKDSGALVEKFATEGLGVDSQTKGGGVWMSGGGISSDNAGSMFFATGNGYASQLSTIPVNGHNPPTALEEAAVHMTINADGSLTIVDFFMPWEKTQLDGADRDLGTSPLELLPSEFACGDVKRIGVVTGKSGKTYWLNLDDLGGYQNGPNKLDDVIQVYQNENSVYAGAGVYPGEGGYIYINVIQYPTHVFKFSCNAGVPSFTKVADSPENNAYLGVGHGTTTSLNDQVGSGLVWVSDVNGYNLRVYNAVPANGALTLINHFNIPGVTKFTRPVFGNGRVYIGTTKGYLYGFGAPVNLPLNCSSPYDFGTQNISSPTAPKTITCTANIAVTVSNITLTGNPDFSISGLPTVPLAVAAGASFSFSAVFNPTAVGVLSSDVVIATTNGVAGYSTTSPISLRGVGQSVAPLLSVSPVTVAFQGSITGQQVGGVNQTVLFINNGNSLLTISSIQYSQVSETGPFVAANTSTDGFPQVGPFTFFDLPNTIPGNQVVTVNINFDTSKSGNFAAYLQVNSDGGSKVFDVVGTSGDAPIALVEFQTVDGSGWVKYQTGQNFTFGNVTENQTRSLKMRITNAAGPDSAKLSLTISKPPFGSGGIIGANNQVDLAEGTNLGPGENATATLYCSVPKTQWDTDSYIGTAKWTLNFNDLTFVKQDVPFVCTAVAEQAPPLLPNGYGQYRYIGCFKENNPGRQLKTQLYGSDNNTNPMCIAACAAGKYTFCGTQYNRECWAGPTIPTLKVDDASCNYPCKGDINQICGGNGVGANQGGAYISLFADSLQYSGNGTAPSSPSSSTTTGVPLPTGGPYVNPGVAGYASMGCYTEATTGRALPYQKTPAVKSVAGCIATCSSFSYKYAGLEYGGECWCGNAFTTGSVPTAITDCNMVCSGNTTEYCGAGQRLNVYGFNSTSTSSAISSTSSLSQSSSSSAQTISTSISSSSSISQSTGSFSSSGTTSTSVQTGTTTSPTQTAPAIKTNIAPSWVYQGCWTEATKGRALSSATYANDSMTLESCGAFCRGFSMFGVEYGRECYCGNSLNAGSVAATNQADCNFICPGNKLEYCGAGVRLELYSSIASGTSTLSSSPISTSSTSVLSTSASSTLSSLSISASSSLSSASPTSASPTSASPTSASPTSASPTSASSISTLSTSASSTFSSSSIPASSSPTSASSTASSTSTSPTSAASTSASSTSTSPTSAASTSAASTSVASTSASPSSASSTSSTSSTSSVSPSVSSTKSTVPTASLSSTSSVSSTISSTSTTSSSPATYTGPPVVSNGNANFTYYGCISEPSSGRLLASQVENSGTLMTIERCLSDCWMYKYAGVEYGRECWCGNTLNTVGNAGATPSANFTDSACGFTCPGNSSEFCGSGMKLNLFYFDTAKAAKNKGE